MNSYFDHSTGFYTPSAAAEAHQAAYRSFSQSLSLVPPTSQSTYQTSNRQPNNSQTDSYNTVDSACKLYDSNGSQSSSAFKSECSSVSGLSKDQTNGFKPPDQMSAAAAASSWNANSLRPSPSAMTGVPSGFEAAARQADAWSACCQTTGGGPSIGPTASSFYPWMAIAGELSKTGII